MSSRQVEPPQGAPTFVFTDIEGSSALWEAVPEAMRRSLRMHDALMQAACASQNGYAVKSEGDAFMLAFEQPSDAMGFAHVVQQTLAKLTWPEALEEAQRARGVKGCLGLRVRMGVHAGEAELRINELSQRADYFGAAVNVAARLSDMAHGAQTLVSEETLKRAGAPERAIVTCLGPTPVRGMQQKVVVHQMVAAAWWPIEFPSLRLGKVATHDEHGKPLPRADLTSEMEGVAYQLLARAQLGRLSGRFDTARFELRAMSAVVDWLGDAALSAECLLEQAAVEYNTAQPADALPYLDRMLSISRELEDARLTCRGLIETSSTLRMLQRFAQARSAADEALILSWKTDDVRLTANARGCLAELDRMEGKLEQAEAGLRASLEVLREHGDRGTARWRALHLGMLLVERGDPEAEELLSQLVEEYEALHRVMAAAAAKVNWSLYYLDRNDRTAFERLNSQARASFDAAEHRENLAAIALNEAYFALQSGELERASERLELASESFPIELEDGLDLEAALLHAWLLVQRGEIVQVRQGLGALRRAAELDESLLGPMALQLIELMTSLLLDQPEVAEELIAASEVPATVTFRVLWRVMCQAHAQELG